MAILVRQLLAGEQPFGEGRFLVQESSVFLLFPLVFMQKYLWEGGSCVRKELGLRGGLVFVQESKMSFVCVQGSASLSLAHVRRALGARLTLPHWHRIQSSPDSPGEPGQAGPWLCSGSGAQQPEASLGTFCAEPWDVTSSLGARGTWAQPILASAGAGQE